MATYQDTINTWMVLLEQAAQDAGDLNYTPGADFTTLIPQAIAYAENRIYKKLVFLNTRKVVTTLSVVAGSRTLDLSTLNPPCNVVEGFALFTPAGGVPPAATRYLYDVASLDTLDTVWPQESQTLSPQSAEYRNWAMKDDKTLVLSPTPDQAYLAEVLGQFQPVPLSASNSSTYLTINWPDAFNAAGMVFWAGHQRDYGMQSDDPKLALSWEAIYQNQERLMVAEENCRRGLAPFDGSGSRQTPQPQMAQSGGP